MALNLDKMTISGPLCHIVTPVGMLGYGFSVADLEKGLETALQSGSPTAIILDSGSTDSGPAKLALGSMTCPRSAYERDLRQLISVVKKYRVPLLISSAGGDGTDAHVKAFLDIIQGILKVPGQRLVIPYALYPLGASRSSPRIYRANISTSIVIPGL